MTRVDRISAPAPPVERILSNRGADDRAFVLRSGAGDPALARWSYAGLTPVAQIDDPLAFDRREARPEGAPPFFGGAVGYVGYDVGWAWQPRPKTPRRDPLGMPAARFFVYETIYARDETTGEGIVVSTDEAARERLMAAVAEDRPIEGRLAAPLEPAVARATHEARIRTALEAIAAGDVYQVNLTYPLVGRFDGDPAAAFSRLAAPPFAAYLDVERAQAIVSASPECFLDFDPTTRTLATFPIKGTIERGADAETDRALADRLVRDPKERAEHLMIVDLLRNDVGRIAEIGSVTADPVAYVESFSKVHHMTTRVRGVLPPTVTTADMLRALFPGGSITGAPRLAAMEIIDAVEDAPRGVYTGMIGYLGFDGSVRTSIAIRTAQIADGDVRFGVGGGIVADSDPAREWRETELKAAALSAALT